MSSLTLAEIAPDARLAHAVVSGDPEVVAALGSPTRDLAAAAEAAASRDLPRRELAAAVRSRLEALDAPQESLHAADRLGAAGSVVVVTGQQPVLFGGPHLAFAKALSAVATARRLSARTGLPVVPVFWSASEDHDHGEADHVSVLTADGGAVRIRAALPADGTLLSRLALPPGLGGALAEFDAALPQGPGRDAVVGWTRPCAADSWGDWVARGVVQALGRFGLVLLEPATIRAFARPVIRHELERPGEFASIISATERAIEALGFTAPLALPRSELFFRVERDRRLRCRVEDGHLHIEGGASEPLSDALRALESSPERFSWNVAGRVLAQDVALPVAAHICGPSELAYVSVVGPAHGGLGVPRPVLLLRNGLTLVDPAVRRACAALGVTAESVVRAGVGAFPPGDPAESADLAALRAAVAALPESSDTAVRRRRQGLERAVDQYREALARAAAAREGTARSRRDRILASLRPQGRLQERVVSILPWVARHGPGLLDRVLEAMEAEPGRHVLLEPGQGGSSGGS